MDLPNIDPVILTDDKSNWEPIECTIEVSMPVPLEVFNDILKSINKYGKKSASKKPKMTTRDGKTIFTIWT